MEVQDTSGLSPLGIVFLLVVITLTWRLPRRSALMPLLITTCYMPLGQVLVVAGLHFPILRLLLLVAWIRVFTRKENQAFRFTKLDKIFMWWVLATLVLGTLTECTMDRFINRCGQVYVAVGVYYLVRCWLRTSDDLVHVLRFLAVMVVPLAVSMIVEKFTTRNVFAVFGGVPEITLEREGKLRCQGAFRHPILAGTYGATLFPLFASLWFLKGRDRRLAILGGCCTIVVTYAAASSGALLALISALIGFAVWPLKYHMRLLRRGAVVAVIALSFMMNAKVWYVFSKLSEVVGGTGWYRSYIIDQAVEHFNEWWLVGSNYTAHWAPGGEVVPADPNNMDIINHYVAEGLGGGVVKLGLFLAMIVLSFKIIGRRTGRPGGLSLPLRVLCWSLGVALFGHCISFFSVSYFDQIVVMWYWLLASVSAVSAEPVPVGVTADKPEAAPGSFSAPFSGPEFQARAQA